MEPREQFEARYRKVFYVEFGATHISIPCTCDDGDGLHWAAVPLRLEAIEEHFRREVVLADLRAEHG